jgi:hypothetical protein
VTRNPEHDFSKETNALLGSAGIRYAPVPLYLSPSGEISGGRPAHWYIVVAALEFMMKSVYDANYLASETLKCAMEDLDDTNVRLRHELHKAKENARMEYTRSQECKDTFDADLAKMKNQLNERITVHEAELHNVTVKADSKRALLELEMSMKDNEFQVFKAKAETERKKARDTLEQFETELNELKAKLANHEANNAKPSPMRDDSVDASSFQDAKDHSYVANLETKIENLKALNAELENATKEANEEELRLLINENVDLKTEVAKLKTDLEGGVDTQPEDAILLKERLQNATAELAQTKDELRTVQEKLDARHNTHARQISESQKSSQDKVAKMQDTLANDAKLNETISNLNLKIAANEAEHKKQVDTYKKELEHIEIKFKELEHQSAVSVVNFTKKTEQKHNDDNVMIQNLEGQLKKANKQQEDDKLTIQNLEGQLKKANKQQEDDKLTIQNLEGQLKKANKQQEDDKIAARDSITKLTALESMLDELITQHFEHPQKFAKLLGFKGNGTNPLYQAYIKKALLR